MKLFRVLFLSFETKKILIIVRAKTRNPLPLLTFSIMTIRHCPGCSHSSEGERVLINGGKNPSSCHFLIFSLFLFLLFANGCRTTEPAAGVHNQAPATAMDTAAMEELYWDRIQQSRARFTDADVEFMTHMIEHHAQALIMSALAPENGASAAVQRLAARIINAQEGEIETMQKWLRDRGQAVPEVHIDGLILTVQPVDPNERFVQGIIRHPQDHSHTGHSHHGSDSDMAADHSNHIGHHHSAGSESAEHHHETDHHSGQHEDATEAHSEDHSNGHSAHTETGHDHSTMHHGHHHSMPGMLTQEQLNELGAARDREFDRLFLAYMIEHHEGAVIMVQDLFAADGAALDNESFDLASGIHAEQVTEIERMRLMLDEITD
ncbi:MAG: DUF305 domain-containing protein [Balneolaceae bacterium]|nr:MAG: DUF305 domain-containing protein [Balneolaceae bacterium]